MPDTQKLRQVQRDFAAYFAQLDLLPGAVENEGRNALLDALRRTEVETRRQVSRFLNLKQSDPALTKRSKISRARRRNNFEERDLLFFDPTGRPPSLSSFPYKEFKNAGVRVKVRKESSPYPVTWRDAFTIPNRFNPGGQRLIVLPKTVNGKRVKDSKGRDRIYVLRAPSLPGPLVARPGLSEKVGLIQQILMQDELGKRIARIERRFQKRAA